MRQWREQAEFKNKCNLEYFLFPSKVCGYMRARATNEQKRELLTNVLKEIAKTTPNKSAVKSNKQAHGDTNSRRCAIALDVCCSHLHACGGAGVRVRKNVLLRFDCAQAIVSSRVRLRQIEYSVPGKRTSQRDKALSSPRMRLFVQPAATFTRLLPK